MKEKEGNKTGGRWICVRTPPVSKLRVRGELIFRIWIQILPSPLKKSKKKPCTGSVETLFNT